ncbi:MAG: TonB-dependent receptor [Bacteroidetes bacterium]|nr:TonB-dependent receptor [Bacteroidota bacterium]
MPAQENQPVEGKIIDAETGRPLIGASVWIPELNTGTTTDVEGIYNISVTPSERITFIFSYIGYVSDTLMLESGGTLPEVIGLQMGMILEEVVISDAAGKAKANIERTRMSFVDLSMKQVNSLPALLSENDVLKAIQLLPGIQSTEGATTGYYVRGGASDQNLIMLNNAVIYNPFHAAGFISIFNGDIVKEISIHKTAFPAKYGGRLSSHLQVDTKDPSFSKVEGSAGIGLVTARMTVSVPIVKEKLAMTVSGRGFYSYALARAFIDEPLKSDLPNYYFYDAFGQVGWKPSDKDKLNLFYYHGQDLIDFQDKSTTDSTAFNIPWSNTAVGGYWTHIFNDNLVGSLSSYHTRYDFRFGADYSTGSQALSTKLREWGARLNLSQSIGSHYLDYGVEGLYQDIRPEVTKDIASNSAAPSRRIADVSSIYQPITITSYFNDDWKVTSRLGINYGVRFPLFYGNNAFYYSIDPKIVMRYKVGISSSLKASYSYGSQFVHMLVSSTATTPLDLWVSSNETIEPQRGHSVAVGYYQNFADNQFEASVEGYYKSLQNQIEYKEGTDVFSDQPINEKVLSGDGWTSGVEFFLRKRTGKVTGFVAYTLAWAKRAFEELNDGKPFDYKYDRRHDMTFSVNYQINPKWSVSGLFIIGSAQALTVPQGVSYSPTGQGSGTYVYDYGDRNSFRLNPYHRLDLSVKYSGKPKRVQSHFKFDIYNVYNRKNSFFVLLDTKRTSKNGTPELYLRDYALIPVLPSISYQIEF